MKSAELMIATANSNRVCVIFPGALGDFICFLPALQVLSQNGSVDLFARSEFAEIVPPSVTVRSLECNEISRLFVLGGAGDDSLPKRFAQYLSVYSWLGSQQPSFVENLTSVSAGGAKLFPFRPQGVVQHQSDYYLRCLQPLKIDCRNPRIGLGVEAVRWCENFWTVNSLEQHPVLTLAPGSGAWEKNWPEEYFLSLAKWWRETTAGAVILLLGPVEAERGGLDQLKRDCLLAGDLSLSQVAALLDRSDIYVGNDSGISHLAGALDVRAVVLFGPADPRQWAPRGERVTVVNRQIACSPCSVPVMKSCPQRACLTELRAGEVIELIAQLPEVATLTR